MKNKKLEYLIVEAILENSNKLDCIERMLRIKNFNVQNQLLTNQFLTVIKEIVEELKDDDLGLMFNYNNLYVDLIYNLKLNNLLVNDNLNTSSFLYREYTKLVLGVNDLLNHLNSGVGLKYLKTIAQSIVKRDLCFNQEDEKDAFFNLQINSGLLFHEYFRSRQEVVLKDKFRSYNNLIIQMGKDDSLKRTEILSFTKHLYSVSSKLLKERSKIVSFKYLNLQGISSERLINYFSDMVIAQNMMYLDSIDKIYYLYSSPELDFRSIKDRVELRYSSPNQIIQQNEDNSNLALN